MGNCLPYQGFALRHGPPMISGSCVPVKFAQQMRLGFLPIGTSEAKKDCAEL